MTRIQSRPSYLPLIFALKDLRVRYYPEQVDSPEQFSRSACLMRGDSVLPAIGDAAVEARLSGGPQRPLPPDAMETLIRRDLPGWPEDAFLAIRGIFAFGPGNNALAEQCALHSLQHNRRCTLARQLLHLLSDGNDPRVPFGGMDTEMKDVLGKMAGGGRSERRRNKPWWRLW